MSAAKTSPAPSPLAVGAAPAPAIDETSLAQLRLLDPSGANNIVQRVLQTYQRSLVKAMLEYGIARAAGDLQTLGRIAHTLRSSSASVGALNFAACCRQVETLVRDGQTAGLDAPLDALQNESVRVQNAIAAMLPAKGSAP
jgi:histidine phosphotransfer protein HptB